jgi:ABC-2 type transport system permease protein
MRVWPVFKKEMRLYFTSPVAWVVLTIFSFITGYFFYSIFAYFTLASMQSMMNPMMARELNVTDSVLRPLFSNISVILLLMMPLVTMRLFAEERRSGTIELLLTYPIRDGAVLSPSMRRCWPSRWSIRRSPGGLPDGWSRAWC